MTSNVVTNNTSPQTFDRELVGDPVSIGDLTLQPVVQARGRFWTSSQGWGEAGFVHLSPTEMILRHADGTVEHLALPNQTKQALFGMLAGAVAVAGLSLLSMFIATVFAVRSSR